MEELVAVYPTCLSYGCVSQGFVYHLKTTISNKSVMPMYIKLSIVPNEGESNRVNVLHVSKKLAPGMSANLTLELEADFATQSLFTLQISQSVTTEIFTRPILALVVPLDVFKHFRKALQLQDKAVFRNGVTVVGAGAATANEEKSLQTAGASVYSVALLDDDDMDDILELPLISNIYWDPNDRMLKMDRELGLVAVNPQWSVSESIAKTRVLRARRTMQLEDMGHYSARVLACIKDLREQNKIPGDDATSVYGLSVDPDAEEYDEATGRDEDNENFSVYTSTSDMPSLHSRRLLKGNLQRLPTL